MNTLDKKLDKGESPASETWSGQEMLRIMENKEVKGRFAKKEDIDMIFSIDKIKVLKTVVDEEKVQIEELDEMQVKDNSDLVAKGNKANTIVVDTKQKLIEAQHQQAKEAEELEMKYQGLRGFLDRLVGSYEVLDGNKKYKLYKLGPEAKSVVDTYAQSEMTGASQDINFSPDMRVDSVVEDNLFAIDPGEVKKLKQELTDAKTQGANCRFEEFNDGLVADINGVKVAFFYNESNNENSENQAPEGDAVNDNSLEQGKLAS